MKSIDVIKELSANQVILLAMKSNEYDKVVSDVIKQLSGKKVCYITLNKTFDFFKDLFEERKIDLGEIIFLDAISELIKETFGQTRGCYFTSPPDSLRALSKLVDKFVRHKFEYLIFDSLTSLLIYHEKAEVTKFVSELINKVKESKMKTIFYVLDVEEQEDLIRETGGFIEKISGLEKV